MIAVVAPYGPGEATSAALRVADEAVAAGYEVRFVALNPTARPLHPFWDGRIFSARGCGPCTAARRCTAVVAFQPCPSVIDQIALVSRARRILVAGRGLGPVRTTAVGFDKLVATSRVRRDCLLSDLPAGWDGKAAWVQFEPGLDGPPPPVLPADGRLRVCVYAGPAAFDAGDAGLPPLLAALTARPDRFAVTLLAARSWPRRWRRTLARLGGAVAAAPCLTLDRAAAAFRSHDLAVLLGPRWPFGLTPLRALACGCRVVAAAAEPLPPLQGLGLALYNPGVGRPDHRNGLTAVSLAAAAAGPLTLEETAAASLHLDSLRTRFREFWRREFAQD